MLASSVRGSGLGVDRELASNVGGSGCRGRSSVGGSGLNP